MEFIINIDNYKPLVQKDNCFVVDTEFIKKKSLETCQKIIIKDIKDKDLLLYILKVDLPKTRIEIRDCVFNTISIEKSTIDEVVLNTVEVSESKDGKFAPFKTFIDSSKFKYLWFYYCKLHNGMIVRKESEIESLSINNTIIDRSFTFINSKCKTIIVESSNVSEVIIERIDYPKENGRTEVDTINIFRSEGLKNIRVWEVTFKNLHIHKVILNKTERLTDHNNEIYIKTPHKYRDVEEIEISESTISSKTIIIFDDTKHLKFFDSSLSELILNYWHIDSLLFSNCRFSDSTYFGRSNQIKTINKSLVENCTFDDTFDMSSIRFKEEAFFRGLVFKKYPSFFYHNTIEENCKTDFQYSNLQNLVFQKIDFRFFSFKEFDITNVEFRECRWLSERKCFISRNLIFDDNNDITEIDELVKVKDIYSKLRMNAEKSSDFLNLGKFYISEQETKRKIHREKKDRIEFLLMSFHKVISSYGENFKKPLFLALCSIILFALLFIFTGFYVGDELVKYRLFSFQCSNISSTLRDFGYSLIYSLKNILPFQVSLNFYLHSDKSLPLSQTLELMHKIINLILATCFTAAFIKYLRK
ncbi:hypothetical protein [Olivibacter domesticus]|uniref:Pentapeptide repeat-containing protein n=1 Tax=Olivibacter domesticus TaxID=407022 RepID=A0A1H7KJ33_OLID1|nr:hypothetical protein [Olivibacter domesticus]SEK86861.1 hypothetical protein SAMN05661044_01373 [Olivibacter domesticus]